jgi:hypothetical protein
MHAAQAGCNICWQKLMAYVALNWVRILPVYAVCRCRICSEHHYKKKGKKCIYVYIYIYIYIYIYYFPRCLRIHAKSACSLSWLRYLLAEADGECRSELAAYFTSICLMSLPYLL